MHRAMAVHKLPAVTSLDQAPDQLRELDAALAAAGAEGLTIDASALHEFDTSALALMLHARRVAKSRGMALQVSGAPPKLRELAQLYGVEELLALTVGGSAT
jgi:phospholipid transport system transporter-binding protein